MSEGVGKRIYGWCYYQVYSKTQRILHYFDLHYAPEIGPIAPTYETQKWCQWCGLRMNIPAKQRYEVSNDIACQPVSAPHP